MRSMLATALALVLLCSARAQDPAQPPEPEAVKKAKDALGEYLRKIGGANAQVLWIQEPGLKASFPNHVFLTARFRIFPVARQLPEGLHPANVFVITGDKLEHLNNAKKLEAFFKANLPKAGGNKAGEEATAAWLAVFQEFVQDGMFKFEVQRKEITGSKSSAGETVGGRALVTGGGNGDIKATLHFDPEGKLAKVEEKAAVRAGPRPICQATLLLDPNPLVRQICEQDLLVMGLAARNYLMEQRARATPELQREIDRVWRQMEKNGW